MSAAERSSPSAEIFISYASADVAHARAVHERLDREDGLTCWRDESHLRHGEPYADGIVEGLGRCRMMVVLLSAESLRSPHVEREVERAVSLGLIVVPLRIERVIPTKGLSLFVSSIHWLDAYAPPFEQHLDTLVRVVRGLLAGRSSEPGAEWSEHRLGVPVRVELLGQSGFTREHGTAAWGEMVSRFERLCTRELDRWPGVEFLQRGGGSLLGWFPTPSLAVLGTTALQRAVHDELRDPSPVRFRAAIHSGEVAFLSGMPGTPRQVVGEPITRVDRIVRLACPDQILVTRAAFDDARWILGQGEDLTWSDHGDYRFEKDDSPLGLAEVGLAGIAPLERPPSTDDARRAVAPADEPTLGWRPAIGLPIPDREDWKIVAKLGEGSFGEAWLARHAETGQPRAFKFCFDADRLRALEREQLLSRILQKNLGTERSDIAKLIGYHFDEPPYYVESEFSEHGDLLDWTDRQGGASRLPLEVRLDLVAGVARAVAAAHAATILHRDLKPSNILVYSDPDGTPRPRLADFGLGLATDRPRPTGPDASRYSVRFSEVDETTVGMYAPPECQAGKPFETKGDVYALGVLLYQMVAGDLRKPLARGWRDDVEDAVLRDDIASSVHGDPEKRIGSDELARRLEHWRQRVREGRRRRVWRGLGLAAAGLALLLGVGAGLLWVHSMRVATERDRAAREAATAREVTDFLVGLFRASDPEVVPGEVTARQVLDEGRDRVRAELRDRPEIQSRLLRAIGHSYRNLQQMEGVEELFREALKQARRAHGDEHEEVAAALHDLGVFYVLDRRDEQALPLFRQAAAMRERLLGPDDPDLARTLKNTADLLARADRYEEARALHERALDIRETRFGPDHEETAYSLAGLANLLAAMDEPVEAIPLQRRANEIRRKSLRADHPRIGNGHFFLGRLHYDVEDHAAAREEFERALAVYRQAYRSQPDHERISRCLFHLGHAAWRAGDLDGATGALREALAMDERKHGETSDVAMRTRSALTEVLREAGRSGEAEALEAGRAGLPGSDP